MRSCCCSTAARWLRKQSYARAICCRCSLDSCRQLSSAAVSGRCACGTMSSKSYLDQQHNTAAIDGAGQCAAAATVSHVTAARACSRHADKQDRPRAAATACHMHPSSCAGRARVAMHSRVGLQESLVSCTHRQQYNLSVCQHSVPDGLLERPLPVALALPQQSYAHGQLLEALCSTRGDKTTATRPATAAGAGSWQQQHTARPLRTCTAVVPTGAVLGLGPTYQAHEACDMLCI